MVGGTEMDRYWIKRLSNNPQHHDAALCQLFAAENNAGFLTINKISNLSMTLFLSDTLIKYFCYNI